MPSNYPRMQIAYHPTFKITPVPSHHTSKSLMFEGSSCKNSTYFLALGQKMRSGPHGSPNPNLLTLAWSSSPLLSSFQENSTICLFGTVTLDIPFNQEWMKKTKLQSKKCFSKDEKKVTAHKIPLWAILGDPKLGSTVNSLNINICKMTSLHYCF